jgi:anti-sigma B factor antagonist
MEVRIPEAIADGTPYVVEVAGDIDIATVGDLEEPVIRAIEQGRRPVILDLSDCVFIDSSGIRLLLRAQHALSENGVGTHRLVVVARDHVARLLRLVALDKVVPVVGSRAEAQGRLDLPTPA